MSKQSEAREKQGYSLEKSSNCGNCAHMNFEMELPAWMREANEKSMRNGWRVSYGDSHKKPKNLRCEIGGFAVKKTAVCNMWKAKE